MLRQLCGNCEHPHPRDPLGRPLCATCDCTVFAVHPDDDAAAERAVAAEAAYYGGRSTILTAGLAMMIGRTLAQYEQDLHDEHGWTLDPPILGVVMLEAPKVIGDDGETAVSLLLGPARLPAYFWAQAHVVGVARLIESIAARAAQQPSWFDAFRRAVGLRPDEPTIGWFTVAEGYVRRPGSPGSVNDGTAAAADEIRQLDFVDVDERLYRVQRRRSEQERASLDVAPCAKYQAASARIPAAERSGGRTADGLYPIAAAMRSLTRLSLRETELRAALAGAR